MTQKKKFMFVPTPEEMEEERVWQQHLQEQARQEALRKEVVSVATPETTGIDEEYLFEYRGFRCSAIRPERTLWRIETIDGSPIPQFLEGAYTGRQRSKDAIDQYLNQKSK